MPLTFHVDIVSAEGAIFSGLASMLVAPTARGEVGVLARHAPLLARLKAGVVRVTLGGVQEGEKTFFVSGGFLEVQPHIVTVLADTALRDEQMDEAAALAAKERVEKELDGRKLPPEEYARLKNELALTTTLLRAIDELRVRRKGRPR